MHSLQYGRVRWFLVTLLAIVIGAFSLNPPLVRAAITRADITACADRQGVWQFDVQGNYIGCFEGRPIQPPVNRSRESAHVPMASVPAPKQSGPKPVSK